MVIINRNFKFGDVADVGVGFAIYSETLRNMCLNVQTLKCKTLNRLVLNLEYQMGFSNSNTRKDLLS